MKKSMKTGLFLAIISIVILSQLAATPSFVGNIISSSVPANFADFWNQVTSENAAKWGSVEGTRDQMNWSGVDTAYNYARQKGFPYKYHCFVWGAQQPSWMSSISGSEQRAEVQEYIQAAASRYSATSMWDVVNEPLHQKPDYRGGLGGDGSTGWDWVITVFEMANQYCSGTLLINEYGIVNDSNATNNYLTIINLLKNRGLIDGIGVQSHCFNIDSASVSTIQSNLNTLANTGLPIYSSEFDSQGDDQTQLNNYKQKFPVFYTHSSVKGITLWGYIVGQTWRDNTGLVSSGNQGASQRPAMQWLMSYIKGNPSTTTTTSSGSTTTTSSGGTTTSGGTGNITVRARGTKGGEKLEVQANGTTVASFTMTTSYANYSANGSGTIRVAFTNDDQQSNGLDIQVDYVIIDGTTYQAENQATNTGVYQNSQCGGSNSEWLHCNGYIEFNTGTSTPAPTNPPTSSTTTTSSGGTTTTSSGSGNITVRARGTKGGEKLEVQANGTAVASFTMSTSYADYSANGSGTIRVAFTNDDQQSNGMDIQVDYVIIDGTTYQAENQATNTGVYQNSQCGGSNSEWLHCNGYIEFNAGGSTPAPTNPPTTTTSGGSTTTSSGSNNITVRARGTRGGEKLEVQANGTTVASFTMSTSYANYSANGSGTIRVAFTNDDQQSNGMDIQVDYVVINGTTYQAENQATNTAVYQNSKCGGSNSEWMHCNGYIQF